MMTVVDNFDVIDEGEDPPTQQNIPRRQEYVFYPPDRVTSEEMV